MGRPRRREHSNAALGQHGDRQRPRPHQGPAAFRLGGLLANSVPLRPYARPGEGEPPTLRGIVNYHAFDDSWVPDMLGGKTMDESGHDNFKGDLLRSDP